MPRFEAGTSFMRSPSISIDPPVIGSRPAIIRNKRGFSAARGANENRELAGIDGEVDAVDDLDVAVLLEDVLEDDARGHAKPSGSQLLYFGCSGPIGKLTS